ncbi:hypothetical protein [Streptomyces cinereoruber]|uniref:hypothetical protein n=1 Tax=Streptomyces cinereoruber TaxID=67260 RepID=UPI00363A1FB9
MADERYQWLDEETAERLLRGEPVDPVGPADDPARLRAGHLADALDALRAPAAEAGELPGEAAALAAFREATAARAAATNASGSTSAGDRDAAATSAPGSAPAGGAVADLGRVRIARVVSPPRRWGRSTRYGLAAAVAAVAVGGVAVAAGTGALPLVGPTPASSVSAEDTARPLVSPEPEDIREDPGIPGPPPPGGDRTPGSSPSAGTGPTAPTAPGDGDGTGGPERDGAGPGRGTAGTDRTPAPGRTGGRDRDGNGDEGRNGGTNLREKAVEACRAYRAGKLDDGGRRRLAEALRDGETLRRYCDRVLSGATGAPGSGPGDGSWGGSKDRPGSGSKGGPKGGGHSGGGDGDSRNGNENGSGDGNGVGRGTARPSAALRTGPAPASPAGPPETGATPHLPVAV